MDTLLVIGARLNSSRLPSKHLLEIGNRTLIGHLFHRLQRVKARAVLATTADEFNAPLSNWADQNNVECFRFSGDVNDLVGRVNSVVEQHKPAIVIYVCGDCPLVSPELIEDYIQSLRDNSNWDGVELPAPSEGMYCLHEGVHAYSIQGWRKLYQASHSELEREHVGLRNNLLTIRPLSHNNYCIPYKQRVSVDTPADIDFMRAIYKAWYSSNASETILDLQWLTKLLESHPEIRQLNKHVMQKSGSHKYGKALFVCEASVEKGIGQLSRTTKLAGRLMEETGIGIEILVIGDTVKLGWLQLYNHHWVSSETEAISYIGSKNADITIYDLIPERLNSRDAWLSHLENNAQSRNSLSVGIDHMHHWAKFLDLVVIPSGYPPATVPENVHWGWRYIISPSGKWNGLSSNKILVLTGGSDAIGYGTWLPEKLDQIIPEGFIIQWIQGPLAPKPDINDSLKTRFELIQSPDNMLGLMSNAKLAISVIGTSINELLAIGVPTIALPAPEVIPEIELTRLEKDGLVIASQRSLMGLTEAYERINDYKIKQQLIKNMSETQIGNGHIEFVELLVTYLNQT